MLRRMLLQRQLAKAYMQAMGAAQLLERMLVQAVDVATSLDALGRSDFQKLQEVAGGQLKTKGPMGPLAKRLRKVLSEPEPPAPTPDVLTRLIEQRNRLAHDYLLVERSTVEDLREAIRELRTLRRDLLLAGATLMRANVDSLVLVGQNVLSIRESERQMWARTLEAIVASARARVTASGRDAGPKRGSA